MYGDVHGDPHIDVNEGNFLRMMTADEVSEMSYGNLKTKKMITILIIDMI